MPAEGGWGVRSSRLVVPAVWLGLVGALAFIETPLKFLAPGMTLELALGLGRIVLTAAEIASAALLLATTALALVRPRVGALARWLLAGLWAVLAVQVAVIRPLLNARTDLVLAGVDPGDSVLHTLYVVADVLLAGLLVAWIVVAAREYRAAARR